MMDYGALVALSTSVREGSFERAAAALGVTASAVSQRIRSLEERVGSILVIRGQPCTPTAIGTQLCAHIERVRLMENEMSASLPALASESSQNGPATLRVAVNADSLGTWFMTAATSFAEKCDATFDIITDHVDDTAERLRVGDVLAAVTAEAEQIQGCHMIPLGSQQYVATASPAFVRRWFPKGFNAASLAEAPAICFDRKDRFQLRWAREIIGTDIVGPTHWIPTSKASVDATLTGFAWGINPIDLVKEHIARGDLVDLAPDHTLTVALQWQHARIGKQLLKQLTADVIEAAKSHLIAPVN